MYSYTVACRTGRESGIICALKIADDNTKACLISRSEKQTEFAVETNVSPTILGFHPDVLGTKDYPTSQREPKQVGPDGSIS